MKTRCGHIVVLSVLIVLSVLLNACSTRKNTAGSRFWQSLNTRYNVYYHGKTNYDEQLKEMLDNYEDDYSQRLFVHPAEARANPKAPQPAGSFDRTIEKMQKAIALHSIKKKPKKKSGKTNDPKYKAWMAREEYNPFMHNCWYTLAMAQYMKGDFLNASATFRYISRHFSWKPDLVQEAQIWEALSYCALGWTSEADNVLSHVHLDRIENGRIRSLANLAFANYHIKEHRTEQAVPYLAEAVKGAKGSQKVRQNFLLGQLYEELDQKDLAYQAYKRAGSSNSSSYRTKFNARIKQSAVYQGFNIEGEVRSLRHMTRYDRNKEYLDQIYYAIGNLYLSRQDTTHAIENYILAAEKSTRNGIDKAISQLILGGIYFAQHKYDKAQPCYAEAVPQLSENYPNYKALKHRSDVLDELAVYSQNVTLQDSLLRLSKMSDAEVKAVIKKIIDELKKKEKEERDAAQREAYLADQASRGNNTPGNKNAPQEFSMNNDKSWYFYNTAAKNSGKTQFQQLWGNRKLEDNWRRRNKNVFSLGDEENELADSQSSTMTDSLTNDSIPIDKEALKRAEDPHYEEYYLKQIPRTEEQIQAANDIIQEGLYNMGIILKDKLEDFDAAAVEFTELLTRYPDNTYRLDTYYNMYLMYMRQERVSEANIYRDLILAHFADSKEGKALRDPNYIENLKNMNREQELLYAAAYASYLNNENDAVHAAYAEMMRKYPLSKIMPKFMFIDALSYVTQRNYDKFKSTIKEMLQRYPETDITPTASEIVKQLNAGRTLQGGGSNARGMLWTTRLSNDTTPASLEKKFTPFKEDNDKPQVFILLYPTDTVNSHLLLYEVARHNFNSFVVKDYDLEQMTFGRLGLLVVKGFANFPEVAHYRTVFDADTSMYIPSQVHRVLISESNFQLLLSEGRSFEDYFNYLEQKEEQKAQKIMNGDTTMVNDNDATKPKKSVKGSKSKKKTSELDPEKTKPNENPENPDNPEKPEKSENPEKTENLDNPEKSENPEKTVEKPEQTPKQEVQQPEDDNQQQLTPQEQEALRILKERQEKLRQERQEQERIKQAEEERKEQERKAREERLRQARHAQNSEKQDNANTDKAVTSTTDAQPTGTNQPTQTSDKRSVRDKKSDNNELPGKEMSERDRLKAMDKAEKERAKERQKQERAREKELKKAEKERQKQERIAERARQDSILKADELREKLYKDARQAKEDSIEALQKAKADEVKNKQKEREQAKKQTEKERKDRIKAREQERKQKAEERKQRQKEREAKRKEQAKLRKQQQKEREQAAKEKQKQREQERKQKAADRKKGRASSEKSTDDKGKPTRSSRTGRDRNTSTDRSAQPAGAADKTETGSDTPMPDKTEAPDKPSKQ